MKVVYQHIYSVIIFASLPYSLFANQTENFSRLNQIDATQQQRQQHIQQAQDKILQPQSDVRLAKFTTGEQAVFRPSKTGPMTIELQRPDTKKIIEVRYAQ